MDRNDYKNLISEARALMKSGGEADALDLLDGVNWRKIRNVNALIEIAGIYEELGHIDDSKLLLEFAHERSPIGRMILYHLTLVCVKMGELEEAQQHLDEFVQIAPHDSKKYILRYHIVKAKGGDIREQISILEDMKNSDFIEEWGFELAYLYYKAGEADKCIALCDEIVIWFGDGPYVAKALELKMLYSPLDDEQAAKYEALSRKQKGLTHFAQNELLQSGEVIRHDIDIAEVEETTGGLNTVNLQAEIKRNIEEIMEATKEGEVSDNLENIKELIEEIPYLKEEEDIEDVVNKKRQDNREIDDSINDRFNELLEEEYDGQMSLYVPSTPEIEEQVEGQITIQDVMDNWAKTQKAAREALESAEDMKLKKAKENAIEEANHIMNKLEDVIPRLEAGVKPSELMKEETLSKADRVRELQSANEEDSEEAKKQSANEEEIEPALQPPATEDDEKEATIRKLLGRKAKLEADQVAAAKEALVTSEPSANEAIETVSSPKTDISTKTDISPKTEEDEATDTSAYIVPKVTADGTKIEDGLKIPVVEIKDKQASTSQIGKPTVVRDDMPNWRPPVLSDEEIKSSTILRNNDGKPQLVSTSEVVKDIASSIKIESEDAPGSDKAKTDEPLTSEPLEEAVIEPVEVDEPLEEAEIELTPEVKSPEVKRMPAGWETSKTKVLPVINKSDIKSQEELFNDSIEESEESLEESEADSMDESAADSAEDSVEESGEQPGQASENSLDNMAVLSWEEKEIFSYFMPVDGMETAICKALYGTKQYLLGKRNTGGHIIVQGIQGCGKTMLATSLVKVLKSQTSLPAGSVGKVDGDKLNGKDIGKLFDKIQGGCLIIEKAGEINRETAIRLALMMRGDKSGILIILEDTKEGIAKVLKKSSELDREFTERIVIPPFTIDELVEFAKQYADECECVIDEMGILALYDRINVIQSFEHETVVAEVKEIMDEAMENADKAGFKMPLLRLGAKKYDDRGYMIIREKNFQE